MYFIELLNFERALDVVSRRIQSQLTVRTPTRHRWVLWTKNLETLVGGPDISLIYCPRLSRTTCDFLIQNARGKQVALYGCLENHTDLPVLSSSANLDELADLLPPKPVVLNSEMYMVPGSHKTWAQTIPAPM